MANREPYGSGERRSWVVPVSEDVRLYVETQGCPLTSYVVALQLRAGGRWQTIRLFDNAHGVHEMHRYTGTRKQPGERFVEGPARDALPAAIEHAKSHWEAIVRSWQT